MDLAKVLHQLHEELDNLNAAIMSLERLQETNNQRTMQPEWLDDMESTSGRGRRKRRAAGEESAEAQDSK